MGSLSKTAVTMVILNVMQLATIPHVKNVSSLCNSATMWALRRVSYRVIFQVPKVLEFQSLAAVHCGELFFVVRKRASQQTNRHAYEPICYTDRDARFGVFELDDCLKRQHRHRGSAAVTASSEP